MQLTLNFGGERMEMGYAMVTWLEGGVERVVELWPYCVDFGWPWWRPFDWRQHAGN